MAPEAITVNVGSFGTFHTMDLARQLNGRGMLGRVYTGVPSWKIKGLPDARVCSFPWVTLVSAALTRLGSHSLWLNHLAIDTYDRWVAAHLEPSDVYHCLSACGLYAHREAKRRFGALAVCDRGSSHIVYQDELLAEEYRRWRIPYRGIDPRIIRRELEEYASCDLICVPSSFALRSFIAKGVPAEKLRRVPYGVDLSTFRPVPKRDTTFRVLYVGALTLQKGIPYLLEATKPLVDVEVVLIGSVSSEIRPLLARYERVTYTGPIARNDLYQRYSQGSVLVVPSIQEGLALVQAQAMACGVPVIATTNTGAEDLFTDGVEGFIVPIRDPGSIREKVVFLRDHPQVRDEMAEAALRRVRSLGGWDAYGDNMSAMYRDALSQRTNLGARTGTSVGARTD